MKRRIFFKIPLAIAGITQALRLNANDRPMHGIKVSKDEDRFNEKIELSRVGSRVDTKVSTKDLEGDLYIYESRTVGKGGPPLHVHPFQDEWIYILEGEYQFQVGKDRYQLKAGDSLLAPRQVPHAFAYVGEGLGKMIIVFQPAGKMEEFFHAAAKLTTRSSIEDQKDFFKTHDLEIVGPPLMTAETKFDK